MIGTDTVWRPAARGRRRSVLCVVLLGHALLLLIIDAWRRPPTFGPEARDAVALRLVPPRTRPRSAPVDGTPALVAPAPMRLIAPQEFRVTEGDAPERAGEAAALSGPAGSVPSAGTPASGTAGLNLKPSVAVLRGALVNPATLDPRSHTPKPTFEERIAMGLDPDLCVKLERDADGVVRRRMGRLVRALTHLQATYGAGAKDVRVCE